jgi:hypothetical protein
LVPEPTSDLEAKPLSECKFYELFTSSTSELQSIQHSIRKISGSEFWSDAFRFGELSFKNDLWVDAKKSLALLATGRNKSRE